VRPDRECLRTRLTISSPLLELCPPEECAQCLRRRCRRRCGLHSPLSEPLAEEQAEEEEEAAEEEEEAEEGGEEAEEGGEEACREEPPAEEVPRVQCLDERSLCLPRFDREREDLQEDDLEEEEDDLDEAFGLSLDLEEERA
jgi:hypothetical protein